MDSINSPEFQLQNYDQSQHRNAVDETLNAPQDDEAETPQQFSLPRADGGTEAWLFLAGCFMIEALIWGFPYSYGVFQEYYTNNLDFAHGSSGIAIIGTSSTGIMYLGAPFVFAALQYWPRMRRLSSIIGLAITTMALVASSFAQTVWQLILTQGVLYAVGGSLLYSPAIYYLDEWFVQRKGFAFGVMWAGTGTSGLVIPLIMNWGLEKYGFRTMLRAWAVTLVLLSLPLLYFVKPRLPPSTTSTPRRISLSFLLTPTFLLLQTGNIFEGLGFFIPSLYLPTYARSLGLSSLASTLTVSLFNSTSVVGQIGLGALTDRVHVTTVILISTLGSVGSVFLLWGFSLTLPTLCIFALSYGVFAGGFTSTWTGVIKEVRRQEPGAEIGVLFGVLAAGRGVGAVVCGPLSEALLADRPWVGKAKGGYGTEFGALIVFTGCTAMLGGVSWVGRRAGWV
ncbi:MAG: hypothetical protein M1827_005263 [Pycnora praestabilis]|nr:MAG: hypothetical protein M1827_005263 [Pycnora praestabilis]